MKFKNIKIGVIGMGYVGLPLAVEFSHHFSVVGFDINPDRVSDLNKGIDSTNEVERTSLNKLKNLLFTSEVDGLKECNFYIVTVPTPINANKRPDLEPLLSASRLIGQILKKNDIVVYESTVYPGATEEDCIPVLEQYSGLSLNKDFYVGYSPERINPGDKQHRLPNIMKVTSGSSPKSAKFIDQIYRTIIIAGTHQAESIKVAEAAKVIENTQRDLNISLINELAIIFNLMGIDTEAVLRAAETKWNFLKFRPGLVGGHCIGVDPYYLTHKAESLGYNPEIILAGRRMNDAMASFISSELIKLLAQKDIKINKSKILILGLSFKEDCPDIRNTKVVDIISELEDYNCKVSVYDPWVDKFSAKNEYDIDLLDKPEINKYDAVVIAVAHKQFKKLGIKKIKSFGKSKHIVYDLKYLFSQAQVDKRL
ncbi:Vi polysaccharide biosynthesis UDP-N-acetylglucosamine C-6 dehydrogenase TviB [Gammaproteobacteria bacterium]|nr:Vi polysaccharide biosynthesis UDP-N-acetylglucosamine C-6 dehydrogenase TviB [Gammaproteobacteria bacterium]MDC1148000.1 Vi polysaccharide biosynthesis UDP-N-acetylglucosamine C-6 dehydrogenase TviB [Gammaproteobacteria bacterium]